MNTQEENDWKCINTGELYVADNYFHHHAYQVLNDDEILDNLIGCFTSSITIDSVIRTKLGKKYKGIKADHLNVQLRNLLKDKFDNYVKFEVNEDKGVFYFSAEKSTIGGFDFAFIDHLKNMTSLRNLCFGELHYEDGQKRWDAFLKKNTELHTMANELLNNSLVGKDAKYESSNKQPLLILGEIQFGNWALAYRDFFKVLKANVQNSIDCLIYVVPTGELESMLSDGIVTYDKTIKILQDFEKVISVPVWVIGLDLKFPTSETPTSETTLF